MKPDQLIRAMNASWVNLYWLIIDPERTDRFALALEVLDDPVTVERTTGDSETAGIRGKGGHSDPTAAAACSDTVLGITNARKELVDHASLTADTAAFVREQVSRILYDAALDGRRVTLHTALADVDWCMKVPHSVANADAMLRQSDRDEDRAELHHAVDRLYRQTCSLKTAVFGHLRHSVRPPSEKPKQKPLVGCVSCVRDAGYFEPIDTHRHNARQMCRRCGDYMVAEGELPPRKAVEWMHRTGKNWTSKVLAEAKRQTA